MTQLTNPFPPPPTTAGLEISETAVMFDEHPVLDPGAITRPSGLVREPGRVKAAGGFLAELAPRRVIAAAGLFLAAIVALALIASTVTGRGKTTDPQLTRAHHQVSVLQARDGALLTQVSVLQAQAGALQARNRLLERELAKARHTLAAQAHRASDRGAARHGPQHPIRKRG